jgi:adhesin HecA-like repeat protein
MANVQVIEDGFRNYNIKVDGAGGDAAVLIVDVSALDPPCTRVRLKRATYDVGGTGPVTLLWDATTDVTLLTMTVGSGQTMDFSKTGGIPNNAGTGITGDVLLTSAATSPYSLLLEFVKSDPVLAR